MDLVGGIRRLARGESNIDFVGKIRRWFLISGFVLVASIAGLLFRKLNLGLEFDGGTAFQVPVAAGRAATVSSVNDVLERFELGQVNVQVATDRTTGRDQILVRAERIEAARDRGEVSAALAKLAGVSEDEINSTDVGPTWGRQISNKMLRALIVFLVIVVAYISLRFEPKMAAAALIAVFHDLLSTAGIYALVGFEVTPATVIALLTLLGYSLYDTVVVFDRVRENQETLTGRTPTTYSEMVNRSVNQVLIRSVNTSLTSLLPVGGLLFVGAFLLGAGTLKDLALALFVGTAVSTYSSIFVAAPILAAWKEREPKYRQLRDRLSGRRAPVAAAPAPAPAPRTESVPVEEPTPGPARAPMPVVRSPGAPRGRQHRGRKRRRR